MSWPIGDISLEHFILVPTKKGKGGLDVADAITSAVMERSIEGEFSLTVEVSDSNKVIVRHPMFDRDKDGKLDKIDVLVDDVWFRLQQIRRSGSTTTLTFEHRSLYYLRQHKKYIHASRGKTTRAEFVKRMVDEVKAGKVDYYSPELHKKQTVKKAKVEKVHAERSQSIDDEAEFTIKGAQASLEQIRTASEVMDALANARAEARVVRACVSACIVESAVKNLDSGDQDSIGVLQLRVSQKGKAKASSVKKSVDWFLDEGSGEGGAVKMARDHPSYTSGEIAWRVQQPAAAYRGRYAQAMAEAEAIIDAYGGVSTSQSAERYDFTRGTPDEKEDSIIAIDRLAVEVNWRWFIDQNVFVFMSEADLFKAKPITTISEDNPQVGWIEWEWDNEKKAAEMRVQVQAKRWAFSPGSVVRVRGEGAADGKWLVSSYVRDLKSYTADLTLKQPLPEKKEPAHTLTTREGANTGSIPSGDVRERIIQMAKDSLSSKTNHNYYSLSGDTTTDPTPARGKRSDCSQWTRAIYLKADAGDPGNNTWEQIRKGKRTSRPQPGDLMFTRDSGHVELYIGPMGPDGKNTIGHGTEPIDYANTSAFPGHFFVTYDFLDENEAGRRANEEGGAGTSSGSGGGPSGTGR